MAKTIIVLKRNSPHDFNFIGFFSIHMWMNIKTNLDLVLIYFIIIKRKENIDRTEHARYIVQ